MQINHEINLLILMALVVAGLWTIMTRSLIRAAICLAITSVLLTLVMFSFGSWLAAVFELSVCAGLISVIFISAISLTEPLTQPEKIQSMKDRLHRFMYLPLLILVVGVALSFVKVKLNIDLPLPELEQDARKVLWGERNLDILGQVIILLAGTFGVVTLFREMRKK